MSKEIHFLEDGYYVEKLEKEIQQLKDKNKEQSLLLIEYQQMEYERNLYKEVIDEVRGYIKENRLFQFKYDSEYSFLGISEEEPRKELLQILDKVKNV